MRLGKSKLYIKELKEYYTPIDLAKQLKALQSQEMIDIDWQKKVIVVTFHTESLFINRHSLSQYKRRLPDYMRDSQIAINQPYINSQGEA